MAMRHAYQQANNRVSSSSDRKMMICGGTALRVDVLMPGRRWHLRPSLTREGARIGLCTRPTKPQWTPSLILQLKTLPNSLPRLTDTGRAAETDHTMPTLAPYCCNIPKGASRYS